MLVETIIYVKFRLKLYQTMRKCQGWHNARFCCFSWLDFRPPNQKKLDYDQILRGNMLDTVQISGGMYDRLSLPRKRSDVLNWGRPPPKTENRALMQQCHINQKCQFWAKFGRFWAKDPFFYWRNHKFCYPHNGKPTQPPCSHCFLVSIGQNVPKMAIYGPK